MVSPRLAALAVLCSIPGVFGGCAGGGRETPSTPDAAVDQGRDVRLDLNADLQLCVTEAGTPCYGKTCGNSVINSPEESCDDGNTDNGDGCSAACQTEMDFECPTPGAPCRSTVVCGDGTISGGETCDDGNDTPGDGCDAECHAEEGWNCIVAGLRCQPICGDRRRLGWEECDDGDLDPQDGCSETCRRETGYACLSDGTCHLTECGDSVTEGDESCDDGNTTSGDGCGPSCISEPTCTGTTGCTSRCGDGLKFPSEGCDDGNTNSGDGCSADCQLEANWDCQQVSNSDGNQLVVSVVYRDFMSYYVTGGHPDFNRAGVACSGMVQTTLDNARKPRMVSPRPACATSAGEAMTDQSFGQWYSDSSMGKAIVSTMTLTKQSNGTFVFNNSASWDPVTMQNYPPFFPVDGLGWAAPGAAGATDLTSGHNFGFTSEVRYWFRYQGGESLDFIGDDDVWVFINGILAVDIGGIHVPTQGSVVLDAAAATKFNLTVGSIYEIVVFQAERHPAGSSYKLTLGQFEIAHTRCTPSCGDGVVNGTELCDDGVNDGSYGGCKPGCHELGPYCGDGAVDPDHEACDNGINRTYYNQDGCAPGCRAVPRCGDGNIDSLWGETCDDGNTDDGDGCSSSCQLSIG